MYMIAFIIKVYNHKKSKHKVYQTLVLFTNEENFQLFVLQLFTLQLCMYEKSSEYWNVKKQFQLYSLQKYYQITPYNPYAHYKFKIEFLHHHDTIIHGAFSL